MTWWIGSLLLTGVQSILDVGKEFFNVVFEVKWKSLINCMAVVYFVGMASIANNFCMGHVR